MKTHCYLSPYHPIPPGNHRYQLRVFVSPAQSNFQFQTVSRSLLNYYYQQVRGEGGGGRRKEGGERERRREEGGGVLTPLLVSKGYRESFHQFMGE